jgi:hypothetical protein
MEAQAREEDTCPNLERNKGEEFEKGSDFIW